MMDTQLNHSGSASDSNESKIPSHLAGPIRKLSHDLSNALEVVIQTNYLLGMAKDSSEQETEQWREMLNRGVAQATQINRELRDFVRAHS